MASAGHLSNGLAFQMDNKQSAMPDTFLLFFFPIFHLGFYCSLTFSILSIGDDSRDDDYTSAMTTKRIQENANTGNVCKQKLIKKKSTKKYL